MTTHQANAGAAGVLPGPARIRAPRLKSIMLVALLGAVLTLTLPGLTAPDPTGTAGTGPAARVVAAQVAGRDPALPADFTAVMGYAPLRARLGEGTVRLIKPTGACSTPLGGTRYGFTVACKAHDFGYDLLRYAARTGRPLEPGARRLLDGALARDLAARCTAIAGDPGCRLVATAYAAGAALNSWRQGYGNPGAEPWPTWAALATLAALGLAGLARVLRRRGAAVWAGLVRAPRALWSPLRGAWARAEAAAARTPSERDRYADLLRVISVLVVVLGHWLMICVTRTGSGISGGNALSAIPALQYLTWVLQVMPVFFFVGGFASLVSWRAVRRRGGGYVDYLAGRMTRLLRPTLVLVVAWTLGARLLEVAGLPAGQARLAGRLVGQPLWFLAVYITVVAAAPAMARVHARHGWRVPALLAAGVGVVDLAWLGGGVTWVGYLNLALVWLLVHQLGFFYADGALARLPRRLLWGVALAAPAALAALTTLGPYPVSMVGLAGARISNMNPPTGCIVVLAAGQLALVMLARQRMAGWLRRRACWAGVVWVGSLAMTVYLWQATAVIAVAGVALGTGVPLPAAGTAAWWGSRPLWLASLAVVLVPLALALARFERGSHRWPSQAACGPLSPVIAGLGAALVVVGLLGLAAYGFGDLLSPAAVVAGTALLAGCARQGRRSPGGVVVPPRERGPQAAG